MNSQAFQSSLIVLVSGPPGAGKSTLCALLARKFGLFWIDKDAIDEPFSPHDRGEHYTETIEPKSIQAMFNIAEANLMQKSSVLLDAPWSHILYQSPRWERVLLEIERSTQSKLIIFEGVLEADLIRKRLQKRGLKRDQDKLTDEGFVRFSERDRIGQKISMDHFEIDLSQRPHDCLRQASQHILPFRSGGNQFD